MSDKERRSSFASIAVGGRPHGEHQVSAYFIGRRMLSNRGQEGASVSTSDHA
jgi:hypothetical protein